MVFTADDDPQPIVVARCFEQGASSAKFNAYTPMILSETGEKITGTLERSAVTPPVKWLGLVGSIGHRVSPAIADPWAVTADPEWSPSLFVQFCPSKQR